MASLKISNKTNRISLPDSRTFQSHSTHELLKQQYPELITPPEEPLEGETHIPNGNILKTTQQGAYINVYEEDIPLVPPPSPQRPVTPPLPPRPRARTIHVVPGFKEDLLQPMPRSTSKSSTALPARKPLPPCQYPDMKHVDRKPPLIKTYPTHHRRSLRAIAADRGRLATASFTVKAWDALGQNISLTPSTDSAGAERVSALAYAGRYLWAGLDDGYVVIMDIQKVRILAELQHHDHAIKHILPVGHTELWTIDDCGVMLRWPAISYTSDIMPDGHIHRVTPKAISAVMLRTIGNHHVLAMTAGDTVEIYRFLPHHSKMPQTNVERPFHVILRPMELGSITQLVALPEGCLACAHKNGRISVWNEKWELTMQVAVPTYEITAMGLSLGRYLWAGYRTGMMYIYDISGERWSLIKVWEAHDAPIAMLAVDEQGLLSTSKPLVQVASADHQGNATIWDGLLSEYRKDQRMKELEETYCDYRPTRIQISSWNIDALDPESITGQDKTLLDEWMTSMGDADIIVVGLQEIVDLESKRQTARTLFLPRKKQDKSESTGMDAELVAATAAIPQYSAWRNHITTVLQDKYTLVKTEHLVGLFSLVFIKHTQQARITDCESTVVKTGLKVMNKCWHGNKGAVAIRFRLDDATLCFVNCHLAAGQSRTEQRNADADGIFKSAKFKDDVIILDHEHCFVSGDLNYRLDTWTRQDVLDWLKEDKTMAYRELQEHDQLLQQRQRYPLSKLAMFREAPIRFDPTYKYDPGSDNYDSSDKQRIPAWCDRVLFHTDAATPEYYKRHEVKVSDHRPISAGFEVPIKTIRIPDYDKVLKVINQAWEDELKTIIQGCKIQYIADYGRWEKEECIRRLEDKQWDADEVIGQHNGAKRKI